MKKFFNYLLIRRLLIISEKRIEFLIKEIMNSNPLSKDKVVILEKQLKIENDKIDFLKNKL